MWNEFKKFALKGNVMDLAVGVVIGAAFGKIVSSLVNNIITPLVGFLLGRVDLTRLYLPIGEAKLEYGTFLQNIIDFFIVAFSIFLVVRALNRFKKKEQPPVEATPNKDKKEELLMEIRDLLKKDLVKGSDDSY
ncbi:MAG TPA: large conductance mechanosensitive channel protein MscL [Pseudoneobacillus sp.]|nr:large conductance mechanosensitive channel protein MscL [Pseudoneobacillus sp.]